MSLTPSHTVEPDWNEIWKAQQKRHATSQFGDDPSHNWNKKENAERYDRNTKSEYDNRVLTSLEALEVTKNSRVLDIGSGPGTLSIPLAPQVREITAVEPGEGMMEILKDHAKREGIRNITCVQKKWEDINISRDVTGPYDIVIASLSLTMYDIRKALEKMDAASSDSVHLFWFIDMPFWERMYADLWRPLHGLPYYAGPKADCLFGVLYQMGIYANVTMLTLMKEYRFECRDEMLAFFRKRFNATTSEQIRIVDDYVTPLIQIRGNEQVISGDSTIAHIWWRKKRHCILNE